jgi:hypothetical protein
MMDNRRYSLSPLAQVWGSDPSRHPATTQKFSSFPVPTRQITLGLLDTATLELLVMEIVASHLLDVGPASTTQITFLLGVSSHLITNQPSALTFLDQATK